MGIRKGNVSSLALYYVPFSFKIKRKAETGIPKDDHPQGFRVGPMKYTSQVSRTAEPWCQALHTEIESRGFVPLCKATSMHCHPFLLVKPALSSSPNHVNRNWRGTSSTPCCSICMWEAFLYVGLTTCICWWRKPAIALVAWTTQVV